MLEVKEDVYPNTAVIGGIMRAYQRNFDIWPFYGLLSNNLYWIRVRGIGYGLAIKRTPLLFSERNGYVKSLPLPFGWRVAILKAR